MQTAAALVANAVCPILAVLMWVDTRRRRERARALVAAAAAGIGVVYLVMGLDRVFDVWGRFGLDYSTHLAMAVALATPLAFVTRAWAGAAAVLGGYSLLMVALRYHSVSDLATTVATVAPICAGVAWRTVRAVPSPL